MKSIEKRNSDKEKVDGKKGLPPLEVLMAIFIPLLVVVSALLFKLAHNFIMDSDSLWSIAVGGWINTHGTVPYADMFSWTVAGEQWTSNSWLFCWLMYWADQYMGYLGIALLIFIPCLITGYFLFLLCKSYQDSPFAILAFLLGISLLIFVAVQPRAYVYTFAFIAIIMFLIRFKRDTKLIYFIPIVFLIWANIQTSIRFGFVIIFIEALVGTIFHKDKKLWPVVILSFLATLINPYGFGLWDISFSSYVDVGTQFITEWRAPDFNNMVLLGLYSIMFLIGLLGLSRLKDDINNKVYDLDKVMILFWFMAAFIYSLTTQRAIAYVILLVGPCFVAYASKSQKESPIIKVTVIVLVVLLFVLSLVSSLPQLPLITDHHDGTPVNFVEYLQKNQTLHQNVAHIIPSGAVNYLEENPALLDRLFNSYIFGGYLTLNNIKVFIDARESVFTRHSVTEDYMNIISMDVKPEKIIDKYNINTFLLSEDERLIFYLELHPEWEKMYEDEVAVVYSRNGPVEGRSVK